MTNLSTVQNSFGSGEIDPRLLGQTDIKAYAQGVRRARNVVRLATGGLERRFGTYDLGPLVGNSRPVAFEFSDAQRYVISLSAGRVDIFSLDGDPVTSIVGAPWDGVTVFELTVAQLGDVMLLCHKNWWPRELVRTSATTFSLGLFVFDGEAGGNKIYQPYAKLARPEVTITPSAASGPCTLTASVPLFEAGHIGLRFRIGGTEVSIDGVSSPTVATGVVLGTIKTKLDPDPFKTSVGSGVVEVQHLFHGLTNGGTVTFTGSNPVAGLTLTGPYAITVIDENHYSVTVGGAASVSEDGGGSNVEITAAGAATRNWQEPCFSSVRGYPGACCFHQGRLGFAGTDAQPDGVWLSRSLIFRNFDVGTGLDGEAIQLAVGSEDISRVLHMVSNQELQLFTATRELVFLGRDGEALTPAGARIKSQSTAGTGQVQPVILDGASLFIQENGRSVSELTYSNEQGGYLAVPVSTLAGHLIAQPVSAASTVGQASRAEQYAFLVNADGSMAVFHSLRSENLAGWGLWTLGDGLIKAVETVGPFIFLTVLVRGGYRLYRLASDEIISLDGAVLHSSLTPKTSWTLDPRVRGRTVHLVTEKGYHGTRLIPGSGVVTMDLPCSQLVAGDAFYGLIETLPPQVGLPSGERARMIKRVVRTILELYDCHALRIDGQRLGTVGADVEAGVQPFTGQHEVKHLGFARSPTVVFDQSEPLPFTLLAMTQEVKV